MNVLSRHGLRHGMINLQVFTPTGLSKASPLCALTIQYQSHRQNSQKYRHASTASTARSNSPASTPLPARSQSPASATSTARPQSPSTAPSPLQSQPPPPSPVASKTYPQPTTSTPSKINPPLSTLPSELVVASRTPDQSTFNYLYSTGKSYLKFYKSGLLSVFSNIKSSQALVSSIPRGTSIPSAISTGILNRAEWQFILRSRQDIKKIPLFALVFICCGEFTPFVVLFMTTVVPRTCKIPKQIKADREKAAKRRQIGWDTGITASSSKALTISELDKDQVQHIGRTLNLYSTLWEKSGFGPPSSLIKSRLKKWQEYIETDDAAILANGGVAGLSEKELEIACEERGLEVLGKDSESLRKTLSSWLTRAKSGRSVALLLDPPEKWS